MRPGVYKLETNKKATLRFARAGGLTPDAYIYGVAMTAKSARIERAKKLG